MVRYKNELENYVNFCLSIKDKKTYFSMLDFFLTPKERSDLATRLSIIKELLKEEKTQREIAADLNVSIAKITRGSNELKRIDPQLLIHLQKILLS